MRPPFKEIGQTVNEPKTQTKTLPYPNDDREDLIPDHDPSLPWPAEHAVDHVPFKKLK